MDRRQFDTSCLLINSKILISTAVPALRSLARSLSSRLVGPGSHPRSRRQTHVIHYDRPAFLVQHGRCEPASGDPWWPLTTGGRLASAIACVGRFSVTDPARHNLGTGWRVRPDVIATNRHLALYFDERRRCSPALVTIDFAGEYEGERPRTFAVAESLYIAEDYDLAFMRVITRGDRRDQTYIELARRPCSPGTAVCTIGFPADNTRFYDPGRISGIFGGIYDVKRVAPGWVVAVSTGRVDHDCTTLGGNSGSVLLDLESGLAVGIHADGIPFVRNHAVPAGLIRERLAQVRG